MLSEILTLYTSSIYIYRWPTGKFQFFWWICRLLPANRYVKTVATKIHPMPCAQKWVVSPNDYGYGSISTKQPMGSSSCPSWTSNWSFFVNVNSSGTGDPQPCFLQGNDAVTSVTALEVRAASPDNTGTASCSYLVVAVSQRSRWLELDLLDFIVYSYSCARIDHAYDISLLQRDTVGAVTMSISAWSSACFSAAFAHVQHFWRGHWAIAGPPSPLTSLDPVRTAKNAPGKACETKAQPMIL